MTNEIELHGPTLKYIEDVCARADAARDWRQHGLSSGAAETLRFLIANYVRPSAARIVEGSITRDKCTCRIHGRPSQYALVRKRLGVESR